MDKSLLVPAIAIILAMTALQSIAQETATFAERCASPDVVLCDPLDTERPSGVGITSETPNADGLPLNGAYRDWRWIERRASAGIKAPAELDTTIKASGTGSLKFTIPSESGAGASGYFQTNFTPDNSVQFGEGETFFVQWRQRFSRNMLFNDAGERRRYKVTSWPGGYKTIIINAGDHDSLQFPVSSCTNQHIVLNNRVQWGALAGYHSCGKYTGFFKSLAPVGGSVQIDYQPGGDTECLRRDPVTAQMMDGAGPNCGMFWPDEWMTFQVQVSVGKWGGSGPDASNIKVWVARESEASRLFIDHNFVAQPPESPVMKYGKIWLLPYHTAKDPTEVHPEAYTWYDELIVSRSKIADPDATVISNPTPDPTPDPALAQCQADLNGLQSDYDVLLAEFDGLLADYNALLAATNPPPSGVPAHIASAPAGEWSAIGTNTMRDVAYDYVANPPPAGFNSLNVAKILTAWGGGVYADDRRKLYINGGGHNDYDGNEWYAFDLYHNQWERVNDPSLYVESEHPTHVYPDGSPGPIHTYGILGYSPATGLLYMLGKAGSSLRNAFSFDPDTGIWTELDHATPSDPHTSSVFWNSTLSEFWGIYRDQGTWGRAFSYDTTSPFVLKVGQVTTKDGAAAFSDERQEILWRTRAVTGDNYAVLDISARTVTKLLTVNPPPISFKHGLAWDSVRNRWAAWHGGKTLYYMDGGGDTWTSATPAGGVTPSAGLPNGTYGRFQYIKEYDVFVGVNSVDESVWLFKPQD